MTLHDTLLILANRPIDNYIFYKNDTNEVKVRIMMTA